MRRKPTARAMNPRRFQSFAASGMSGAISILSSKANSEHNLFGDHGSSIGCRKVGAGGSLRRTVPGLGFGLKPPGLLAVESKPAPSSLKQGLAVPVGAHQATR